MQTSLKFLIMHQSYQRITAKNVIFGRAAIKNESAPLQKTRALSEWT